MAVSDVVLAGAARTFPVEPVRTLNAIQLATALEFATAFPDVQFSSVDQPVRSNAEALDLV